MSAHTPGPWSYEEGTTTYNIRTVTAGRIAVVRKNRYTENTRTQADARLMTAAPELLESLRWAMCHLQEVGGEDNPQYVAAMRSIAKATGEQA